MNQFGGKKVAIVPTDDGLFLAYYVDNASLNALGETEDEAEENLYDKYDFCQSGWGDVDDCSYYTSSYF